MTYLLDGDKSHCCGCGACVNVCKHAAISMKPDIEGFLYPQKNEECINCSLCEKSCPYTTNDSFSEELREKGLPKVFAAYSEKERSKSSSGGLFYVIAKRIILNGGIVFGAAFDKELILNHEAAKCLEELDKLRGSKYVQSNIGNTYREVLEYLKAGIQVFFVGTPCQVAGLKSFLRKDYPNLLTADVVCHGVPSQWLFKQHKEYLEKKNHAKLINYEFRDNSAWGGCEKATFSEPSKKVVNPTYELSPYLFSFMYGFTFRYSCYECPFASVPRQGDLTLGDYWGVKRVFPDINSKEGVSVILVNNQKGDIILNAIKDELILQESCLEDASRENGNLINHSIKPAIRDEVYSMIRERGYEDLVKNEFRSPKYKSIKKSLFKNKYLISPLSKVYHFIFSK